MLDDMVAPGASLGVAARSGNTPVGAAAVL